MKSFKPILKKIKKIKNKKGYTNETLAKKSGIPLSTLNKILSSVIKDPKIGTIIAITDALEVDINSLIYDKIHINKQKKLTDILNDLTIKNDLTSSDIDFILKYIQLSKEDRTHFLSILNILATQDNIPKLNQTEHNLSIAEKPKHHIIKYEPEIEEKEALSLPLSSNS